MLSLDSDRFLLRCVRQTVHPNAFHEIVVPYKYVMLGYVDPFGKNSATRPRTWFTWGRTYGIRIPNNFSGSGVNCINFSFAAPKNKQFARLAIRDTPLGSQAFPIAVCRKSITGELNVFHITKSAVGKRY